MRGSAMRGSFKNERYIILDNLVEVGGVKSFLVEDKEERARKILKVINSIEIDRDFFRNVDILKRVNSEHIINYYHYFKVRFHNYIILEYFEVSVTRSFLIFSEFLF
jgi:hypothetical protein